MWQTLTILASSHQSPERHAHRGLRDDGVPVLHVQPVPPRLRHLRVVVQELEQDDDQAVTPRPEPQRAAMSDQNRALGQKGRLTRKEGTFYYKNISGEGIIFISVSY